MPTQSHRSPGASVQWTSIPSPTVYVGFPVHTWGPSEGSFTQNGILESSAPEPSSSTASYPPALQPSVSNARVPSVGLPPPVGWSATVPAAGSPPAVTTATCSPGPPGEWKVTFTFSHTSTRRSFSSTATKLGGEAGATWKLDTTMRWSEGHGCTPTSASGESRSPTINDLVGVASGVAYTRSIRSCGAQWHGYPPNSVGRAAHHVRPGCFFGSG